MYRNAHKLMAYTGTVTTYLLLNRKGIAVPNYHIAQINIARILALIDDPLTVEFIAVYDK